MILNSKNYALHFPPSEIFSWSASVNQDHQETKTSDIFDSKTNEAHHNKETSGNNVDYNGSSTVMLTQPCAGRSKVATTTPEMIVF